MKKSILLFILFWMQVFIASAQVPVGKGLNIGDQAPDFKLKGVDGKLHQLPDLKKNKGVVVVFTCNTCPFAQAYEGRIIALHKKYAAKGFPVVAINPNDPVREAEEGFDYMVKLAKEHVYPFPYLVDENQEIAKSYGAVRTPHIFVLDKNRKVVYIGAIDDNFEEPNQVKEKYLENALQTLLAGKLPNPAKTKAIGCGIKWKK